jgi:hypothetical protein
MFNVYKNQLSPQTGKRNLTGPKTLPIIWYTYSIFLSNYWWQKSDIWSQASYRYPISWEAFFDPSDSYFLFAEERGYHKWALAHSSSCFCVGTRVWRVWKPPLFGKQEVGIWRIKKRFPRYGVPIWSLWPNIRFLSSIVTEKNPSVEFHVLLY